MGLLTVISLPPSLILLLLLQSLAKLLGWPFLHLLDEVSLSQVIMVVLIMKGQTPFEPVLSNLIKLSLPTRLGKRLVSGDLGLPLPTKGNPNPWEKSLATEVLPGELYPIHGNPHEVAEPVASAFSGIPAEWNDPTSEQYSLLLESVDLTYSCLCCSLTNIGLLRFDAYQRIVFALKHFTSAKYI